MSGQPDLNPERKSRPVRWGMTVDLNRCVGCQTCTIACKHANDTPPAVQWRQVHDIEMGRFPDVERLFLVTGCQHCAEPPCVPVCPSGATAQRADGLVTMDYDLCIGCGYCAVACPYQARTIAHDKRWYYDQETKQEAAVAHDERLGVAQKCTFCVGRIDEAAERGLKPGVDPEVTPACSASCITKAIQFGDFNDPDSIVSRLAREQSSFQMHEELGTDPQIRYLYESPVIPGRTAVDEDADEEALSDPDNPLSGKRQTFWDARAAMNFTLGGMSSGLAVIAYLCHRLSTLSEGGLLLLFHVAGALMAIGLFFVFLEIGRKLRFMNVLRRPQSSWMTRETYAVAVLFPALLVDLLAPHPALHAVIAAAAAAFLFCQARILFAGKGIPAWRAPLIPWMLIATGLFEGLGVLLMMRGLLPEIISAPASLAGAGILLALTNGWLWRRYCAKAKAHGIQPLARRELTRISAQLAAIGHSAPVLLLAGGLLAGWDTRVGLTAAALAGLAAAAGGALWKFTVVTRASYHQGFALAKLPRRGSGGKAPPARREGLQRS